MVEDYKLEYFFARGMGLSIVVVGELIVIKTLLKAETKNDTFLPPTETNIDEYLDWDDWKVGGLIKEGKAGLHGEIILNRLHYRRVYETKEVPDKRVIGTGLLTPYRYPAEDITKAFFRYN